MISRIWKYLIGPTERFSLENRILNAGGILSLTALAIFFVYDLVVVVVPVLAWITLATFAVQFFFFYLSRFREQFPVSRLGFSIGSYVFIILNYLYSGGINGGSLLGFFLTYVVIIVINPKSQHIFWTVMHCLVTAGLLWYDYSNPQAILNPYVSFGERYVDIAATFTILISLLGVIVTYVIRNYNKEKEKAVSHARELGFLHNENARLFSIISHDLRSPLNSIQGYLELLTEHQMDAEDRAAIESNLLSLTKSTSDMLFNLLAWSKSQLDGRGVQMSSVLLLDTLRPMLEVLQGIARHKRIQLAYDIPADCRVMADPEMLTLVMRNLLYNAIKFTPEQGWIKVSTFRHNHHCTITIQDSGRGIPADKQPLIFTTQVKSTPGTNSEKGIGLGLVLCRDFTELQQGRIWFDSEEGKGTTFYVSFALADSAEVDN